MSASALPAAVRRPEVVSRLFRRDLLPWSGRVTWASAASGSVSGRAMITTLQIADRGVVLELGRLGASGSGVEMLDDPEIRSAYLGIQG